MQLKTYACNCMETVCSATRTAGETFTNYHHHHCAVPVCVHRPIIASVMRVCFGGLHACAVCKTVTFPKLHDVSLVQKLYTDVCMCATPDKKWYSIGRKGLTMHVHSLNSPCEDMTSVAHAQRGCMGASTRYGVCGTQAEDGMLVECTACQSSSWNHGCCYPPVMAAITRAKVARWRLTGALW
jgi:hypothetical protein